MSCRRGVLTRQRLVGFKEKFLVQRDRVIVLFSDIPEAINRFENACPLRAVHRLAQQNQVDDSLTDLFLHSLCLIWLNFIFSLVG